MAKKKKPQKSKTVKNTELMRNTKGQFVKGNLEGNRSGRPKMDVCIPHILREIMAKPITPKAKRTKLDAILNNVVDEAINGDSWSIQFIADRTEGRPSQSIEMKVDDLRPKYTGKNPIRFLNEYINFQNAEA